MDVPSGGGQAQLDHVAARRSLSKDSSTSAVAATPTEDWNLKNPATADGTTQYFGFLMGVSEYCESSEGTPLKAKGYWRLAGANAGYMVTFPDANTATVLNLNTGKQLQVGPCKCPTHQWRCTLTRIFSKMSSIPIVWASPTETVIGTRITGDQTTVAGVSQENGLATNSIAR
jgi:hypothetical protein